MTIEHTTMRRRPGGRAITLLAVALIALTCLSFTDTVYTFTDEFDGPAGAAPDPAKWSFDEGGGGWGNNELQVYTDSRANSFLDGNGNLVIRATRAVEARHSGGPPKITYQSARLTTMQHFSQKFGHWEARLKVDSRRGLWPASWMLGENFMTDGWPQCGEVDLLEDYGFSAVESSIHVADGPGPPKSYSGGTANDQQFHVFRMDWSTTGISFFRDGVRYAAVNWRSDPGNRIFNPDHPMFLLLNLAVGGDVGHPLPDTQFPVDFVIDYVRVWE